ncbi:NAD(P)/FAD-dependent oxidoreductase [Pseudosulfitobacter pseudonitzschiae]|uniref:NAD(P)/FAD-dependent oxidoreductase n=1 Tax=Pseudosulfitobacter pseudonitzschiae TaxID=1402135 RepID=UPI001AF35CDD|nr:FAD-dependent oxidoreductase [Pseudosulfitobacter pseudonitzschiae]MBM1816288.1 FAD-binding oxidoreductase [Pseudosulfitobacter pseudonitzschiae]MBM1833801.1 FAD-binding oxidoreductase [Pseudosulfitobacter pseudonitzschiae]MBM1838667.1 FAD-binding oxidoreductase [Pseudosulfitobacter pseudonitzschiae]MBM1843015.1 FAD-binding oxidoreductase [Pseudosulfitobacter pseudonitzschiae]MBM1847881.1 FAD-binding oxidoreductase [Pseudosulfitobacter pseudonitzschiae]
MNDIVVIGGGIAGISAAARLSAHGRVTVLEAEGALGYHASGRSAALFEKNYGLPSVIALNHASDAYHQPYLSPRGFMLVGRAGEDEGFDADAATLKCPEISVEEARAIVPILNDRITRAAYHLEAYDIDTDRMIQDFARQVRSNGGQVLTKASVTQVRFADGLWTVTAGGQEHQAPTLVNAAGAWADQLAEMAGVPPVGIAPFRRSMARIPAPGGHDISGWPIFFGVNETWYAKPDAGSLLVSPAEEHATTPHDAWPDDMVLAEGLDRYSQHVTTEVTRLEASWAGLRSFAPDRTLVLGRDATNPAFVWCAGQGGYGFQTAPAASQLLADLVTGRTPEIDVATVASLSPARFNP